MKAPGSAQWPRPKKKPAAENLRRAWHAAPSGGRALCAVSGPRRAAGPGRRSDPARLPPLPRWGHRAARQ
ncbi:hypothetical protein ACM14_23720 [Delftia sp. JD2]|nr:hypothetical protein ACM14_23720 [Delftia sp. JD2]